MLIVAFTLGIYYLFTRAILGYITRESGVQEDKKSLSIHTWIVIACEEILKIPFMLLPGTDASSEILFWDCLPSVVMYFLFAFITAGMYWSLAAQGQEKKYFGEDFLVYIIFLAGVIVFFSLRSLEYPCFTTLRKI